MNTADGEILTRPLPTRRTSHRGSASARRWRGSAPRLRLGRASSRSRRWPRDAGRAKAIENAAIAHRLRPDAGLDAEEMRPLLIAPAGCRIEAGRSFPGSRKPAQPAPGSDHSVDCGHVEIIGLAGRDDDVVALAGERRGNLVVALSRRDRPWPCSTDMAHAPPLQPPAMQPRAARKAWIRFRNLGLQDDAAPEPSISSAP